jgi:hypothetical protein
MAACLFGGAFIAAFNPQTPGTSATILSREPQEGSFLPLQGALESIAALERQHPNPQIPMPLATKPPVDIPSEIPEFPVVSEADFANYFEAYEKQHASLLGLKPGEPVGHLSTPNAQNAATFEKSGRRRKSSGRTVYFLDAVENYGRTVS